MYRFKEAKTLRSDLLLMNPYNAHDNCVHTNKLVLRYSRYLQADKSVMSLCNDIYIIVRVEITQSKAMLSFWPCHAVTMSITYLLDSSDVFTASPAAL